jgi:hypothetical protein
VDEAENSLGTGDEMTVLVGSLPCQFPVENRWSGMHGPNPHRGERMRQAPGNMSDGWVKRP